MRSARVKLAARTAGFTESVIREMTRLNAIHGGINLAQGFPNFAAPQALKDAAKRAIDADINQYAITWGAKSLRDALSRTYAEPPSRTISNRNPAAVTSVHASSQASFLNLPLEASRRRNARYCSSGSFSPDKKR